MAHKSYKKESRYDWGRNLCEEQNITFEQIQLGAILRIADAAEAMAKNHQQLIDERDRYKRWYEGDCKTREKLYHRIAGLQGHITRLKKMKEQT